MSAARPSQWPFLFDLAVDILASAERLNGFAAEWSFGGGTARLLHTDHREGMIILSLSMITNGRPSRSHPRQRERDPYLTKVRAV